MTESGAPEPDETESSLDLRILTPGLSSEEIAAVTSVVTAMIEEQRGEAARTVARPEPRWRRALEPFGERSRGPIAWRHATR